ncbi:hypothetical protein B0T24DRAFT_296350 [Lasiosphaeria ovina]|uniref:Uncharacterized protein n=1 Tax=Lasiosphaeria ovina TaxID=92902 RepID=A0AAE0KE15_9PEZI|nr:hypothetical protein B0T24DRAFT_296350 [Lasiosphaeria ovina]
MILAWDGLRARLPFHLLFEVFAAIELHVLDFWCWSKCRRALHTWALPTGRLCHPNSGPLSGSPGCSRHPASGWFFLASTPGSVSAGATIQMCMGSFPGGMSLVWSVSSCTSHLTRQAGLLRVQCAPTFAAWKKLQLFREGTTTGNICTYMYITKVLYIQYSLQLRIQLEIREQTWRGCR